jgi:5-methylcytosine-specific restriction protein B
MTTQSSIRDSMVAVLAGYLDAKQQQFAAHPMRDTMRNLAKAISETGIYDPANVSVLHSIGQGNWADIPWVAMLDQRETPSVQEGVYPVVLFRADMSGCYLTIAQGVTKLRLEFGAVEARARLETNAKEFRAQCAALMPNLELARPIDLRGSTQLAQDYEASVIAHKFYPTDSFPNESEILGDLGEIGRAYEAFCVGPGGPAPRIAALSPTAENIVAWLRSQNLRFNSKLIATFLTALSTKGFVILGGYLGPVKPSWHRQ